MKTKTFLSVLVLLRAHLCLADNCTPVLTSPENVNIQGNSVLIVTHASTEFDARFASKAGIDRAVKSAKAANIPVVYLVGPDALDGQFTSVPETYFVRDCSPTYWVDSLGGEIPFDLKARHVLSVGGHWELCQQTTTFDVFAKWTSLSQGDFKYTQIMDGLYIEGSFVKRSDGYFTDFENILDFFTLGKSTDVPRRRKMSLLEAFSLIREPALQIEFLKRNLPPFSILGPDYRVSLSIDGQIAEVVQQGRPNQAPNIELEFLTSMGPNT